MSVRAVESRFNLRSVVEEETTSRPLVLVPSTPPQTPFSPRTTPNSGLKFDFSSIHKSRNATTLRPPTIPENQSMHFEPKFKNAFGHSFVDKQADVMRLTAVVEDLNARLKNANQKSTLVESQLQRAQMSIVAERASSVEKIRDISAQLGDAHNTEAQLRTEISIVSRAATAHKDTIPKLEAAVAAAAVANEISKKTSQENDDLQKQISEQISKSEESMRKAQTFKEQNVKISAKIAELEVQFAEAKRSEKKALEERDSVADALRVATESMMDNVTTTKSIGCCTTSKSCGSCSSPASSAESSTINPIDSIDPSTNSGALQVQVHASAVANTTTAKSPESNNYPNPIKMHARYNLLRDTILKVSACIVAIESGEAQSDKLEELIAKRNELFKRAKALKFRYDTIFGSADPKSVVEFTSHEPTYSNDNAIEDISFVAEGDAPSPPCTYIVSFAKEMSQSCSLGGTFDFGSYDSGAPIGDHVVPPVMSDGKLTESMDETGAHNDMVNAVVADLTNFLQDFKLRNIPVKLIS